MKATLVGDKVKNIVYARNHVFLLHLWVLSVETVLVNSINGDKIIIPWLSLQKYKVSSRQMNR